MGEMNPTLNNRRMSEPIPSMSSNPAPVPVPAPAPVQAPAPPSASAVQPDYTVWSLSRSHSLSVLPGPCSFLQCPECPRKLPLDSVHHHLVRTKLFWKYRAPGFLLSSSVLSGEGTSKQKSVASEVIFIQFIFARIVVNYSHQRFKCSRLILSLMKPTQVLCLQWHGWSWRLGGTREKTSDLAGTNNSISTTRSKNTIWRSSARASPVFSCYHILAGCLSLWEATTTTKIRLEVVMTS